MGFRHIAAALIFAVLSTAAFGQSANKPSIEVQLTGQEDAAAVERILKQATKAGSPVTVRVTPPSASAKDEPIDPSSLIEMVGKGIDLGVRSMGSLAGAPKLVRDHLERNAAQLPATAWWSALGIVVLAGLLALLVWRILSGALPDDSLQFSDEEQQQIGRRILISLRRAVADVVAILVFMKLCHGLSALLLGAEHPLIVDLMRRLVFRFVSFAFYVAAARAFLAPYKSGYRLVPLPNAERYKTLLIVYGMIGPIALCFADVLRWTKSDSIELAGWFMISSTCIVLYKIWFFLTARQDIAELIRSGRPNNIELTGLRQTAAVMAGPILACFAAAIWLLGRVAAVAPNGENWGAAASATQFYVILTPLFAAGANRLMRAWLNKNQEMIGSTPLHHALRETLAAGTACAVWLLAIADLGRVWSNFLNTVVGETGVNVLHGIVSAAVTAILGMLMWIFLANVFRGYQPRPTAIAGMDDPSDPSAVPPIQSRLSSVMPVLRILILGLVLAITALLVLSRLGIDTGPLLAGFGIMGLALSFGSQALVRDVVAGIFFLADDAFRVGEYIDTGKLKGTVERISLRAVQLRHQSGLVHTIPHGQVQAVTNASRDWATVKFTIRLDRNADIEKARKIIKKIGQDLLTHEEFGTDFILPVKFQGIVDVQDNALIARIKFTAKPFRTSQIQREALKRIYLGLIAGGVPLASNEVRVRSGSQEDAAAAFAKNNLTLPAPAAG